MSQQEFQTSAWFSNPHYQTIWPRLARKNLIVPWQRQRLELPDGDFLDLDIIGGLNGSEKSKSPIVLVLHGLEGSSNSHYARAMGSSLASNNFRVVVMNFRGCSGVQNRLQRSYHSGETEDLNYVVNYLRKENPGVSLFAVGFSLGGNVLLKWLGEQGSNAPITSAVAVSVPFDLGVAADKMTQGVSRIYQKYFLSTLIPKIIEKNKIIPLPVDVNKVQISKTLREYDDCLTAPLHGFKNAEDYYQQSSCNQYLRGIETPALIIHSLDDPFMTPDVIPKMKQLSKYVSLDIKSKGGHVGFIGKNGYWLDKNIPSHFRTFI